MMTALAMLASVSLGVTLELPAVRDSTMYGESALGMPISNGMGEHFFCGTNVNGFVRRGLLAFDLSSIPPGSALVSVRVRLFMSRTLAGETTVSLHRALGAWGEGASDAPLEEGGGAPAQPGDATWIDRVFPGTPWLSAGGDFVPGPSATTAVEGIGFYEFADGPLVGDVESWLAMPESNNGWVMLGDESAAQTSKRFATHENPTMANRPTLVVEFIPPACPGDADGNGMVGLGDIASIINCWGQPSVCDAGADLDDSGDIGLGDVAQVIKNWAEVCP